LLLTNYNVFNSNPGHCIGGVTDPTYFMKGGSFMLFYSGDANVPGETNKSSFNNGYVPPYAWWLAPKPGGLGSIGEINGTSAVVAGLASGKALEATLAGSGAITPPSLSMVVQAAAALSGSGLITDADLVGKVELAASLAGVGDLDGALGALAFVVASLSGSGSITPGDLNEIAHMSADISPFTELSPENLAAAVWNALAASYSDEGTMGEVVNEKLLTLIKFLALK
jgi:hypothetical protein